MHLVEIGAALLLAGVVVFSLAIQPARQWRIARNRRLDAGAVARVEIVPLPGQRRLHRPGHAQNRLIRLRLLALASHDFGVVGNQRPDHITRHFVAHAGPVKEARRRRRISRRSGLADAQHIRHLPQTGAHVGRFAIGQHLAQIVGGKSGFGLKHAGHRFVVVTVFHRFFVPWW